MPLRTIVTRLTNHNILPHLPLFSSVDSCHALFRTLCPTLIPCASPHCCSPTPDPHTPDSIWTPCLPPELVKSPSLVSLDTLHVPLPFHALLGPHLHPLPYHLVSHLIICSAPRPYAPLSYASAPHAPHSYTTDILHRVGLRI